MPKPKPKRAARKKPVKSKTKRGSKPAAPRKKKMSADDAKRKLFESFVNRIGNGVVLRPSEIKLFRQLQAEIDGADADGNGGNGNGQLFVNSREAGKYAGISHVSITRNVKNGRLKQNPDGTFSKDELDRWVQQYGKKQGAGVSDEILTIKQQQEKADLRFRIARARKEEILAAQLEKTLAPWEEIESEWAARVREVVSGLGAWSDRLPALIVGRSREDIHKIIRSEVKELQERFARVGRYCPECG